ncbi:endo alpha-1,4 polygalactosaminidase [Microbacterium sp. NPDC019599]|uniref:endo alpha-1,4 polygalactosaminidase n=1 Tax=Microbacterium sp. NPDC019599 TaxID=3154690 RepID=UPI0033C4CE8C
MRTLSVALTALLVALVSGCSAPPAPDVALPPAGAVADYQLGGAYDPAPEVTLVVRDSTEAPAPGRYSVCYLNAFQTQPGETPAADLLLTDQDGESIADPDWPDERLVDIRTDAALERAADGIARCADAGFDAVEFDNLDSFTRSAGLLDAEDALAFAADLVQEAHAAGLAAGQKNTAELTEHGHRTGFDFAVAEECDVFEECAAYTDVYGDAVIAIEYTDDLRRPFAEVCADPDRPATMILRDRDLVPAGEPGHVFEHC